MNESFSFNENSEHFTHWNIIKSSSIYADFQVWMSFFPEFIQQSKFNGAFYDWKVSEDSLEIV